ncbi:MAG: hypothetical protein IIB00_01265, partial [candidate division Zixibacteria bacterium]|nr:hypothetical protein [candidate division Zixibacteria bacterium]
LIVSVLGCSDTDPVLSSFTESSITLSPSRLPSPPDGMIYELWVVKVNDQTGSFFDYISIELFDWDQDLYVMRDASGVKRSRVFDIDFNILDYDILFVSIEQKASTGTRSSIMLADIIAAPEDKAKLQLDSPFPFDQFTTGVVSVVTPSVGSNSSSGISGVWFAFYSPDSVNIIDTIQIKKLNTGNNVPKHIPRDTIADDTLGTTLDTLGIDSVSATTYRRFSNYGLDTFVIKTVVPWWHVVPINRTGDTVIYVFGDAEHMDSVAYEPDMNYVFNQDVEIDIPTIRTFSIDIFTTGFQFLPSLTNSGWHYKGWVLGPRTATGPAEFVRMNFGENSELNWEKEGRLLLPTGVFHDTIIDSTSTVVDTFIFGPDTIIQPVYTYSHENGYHKPGDGESHPFLDNSLARVPPFPGEDFLSTSFSTRFSINPSPGSPISFVNSVADTAIAFITLEPDNYTDTSKNFPLVVLARELAFGGTGTLWGLRMLNQTGTVFPFADGRKGWPSILAEIEVR